MTELAVRRKALIERSINSIKDVIDDKGLNRESLEEVRTILTGLTGEKELFSAAEFPAPKAPEVAKIYLLTDEDGGAYSLYLVSALPGRGPSPVHNHATFAVIAGMDGEEANTIYRRLDDGGLPGRASLEVAEELVLKDGDSVAFMPDDIHRVQVVSQSPTRHFHFYGKGFNQQTDRLQFDVKDGTVRVAGGSFIPVDASRRVV